MPDFVKIFDRRSQSKSQLQSATYCGQWSIFAGMFLAYRHFEEI